MNFIEDFAETIKNIQGFQPDLFAGATETELKAAEEKMNIMLPEDFKKFYRAFNGQNEYADALFDTFFLCSLKQILYFWDAFKFNEEDFLQIPAEAEPGIKMYGAAHCGCLLPQRLTDIACALILHRQKAAMQGRLLLFGITRRSVNLLRHPLRILLLIIWRV